MVGVLGLRVGRLPPKPPSPNHAGRGGTSDTWLFQDKATKEAVAIKLMRRPIPPVLETSLLREITVRPRSPVKGVGDLAEVCKQRGRDRLWVCDRHIYVLTRVLTRHHDSHTANHALRICTDERRSKPT